MKITRRFTQPGQDVYTSVEWTLRTSRITNADGSVVFEMKDAEVPKSWSQLATDICVSKYFRKAGVLQAGGPGVSPGRVTSRGIAPADKASQSKAETRPGETPGPPSTTTGPERSVRQV